MNEPNVINQLDCCDDNLQANLIVELLKQLEPALIARARTENRCNTHGLEIPWCAPPSPLRIHSERPGSGPGHPP